MAPKIKTQDKSDSILSKALGILAWPLTPVVLLLSFSHKSTQLEGLISFTLATRDQIRDTYMYIFSATTTIPRNIYATEVVVTRQVPVKAAGKHELLGIHLPKRSIAATVEPGRLAEMAQQFSDVLPERTFPPAEVQGYLLMHKMDTEKAIEEVGK
ncbi:hypothetical protein G6011_03285 [Alternaria panax]|uniref:Mitochondrial chaperone BCS1-like ATPase lid domain-containing protein n=1 Tax=Alternaria panax TaxID=48097 RepID=A0AAD4IEU1_9PLEO|nr:hypothetical protein G6011_03285 [Alternaria panax]